MQTDQSTIVNIASISTEDEKFQIVKDYMNKTHQKQGNTHYILKHPQSTSEVANLHNKADNDECHSMCHRLNSLFCAFVKSR